MSEIKITTSPNTGQTIMTTTTILSDYFDKAFDQNVLSKVVEKLVIDVVEEIVKQKFGEILAKVDTQAIANLAIARCANITAEELKKSK